MFSGIIIRELLMGYRRAFVWLTPLVFFVLVGVVFSIAVGAAPATLRQIATGVIWTAALLSSLLAQDSLFRYDGDCGYLEQALLSAQPLVIFVAAKIVAHWLLSGLPLLVITPLLALLLNFPNDAMFALLITIPLGALLLSLLAAFGAALTLGQNNSLLLALLTLPFAIPVLIFAVSIANNAGNGMPYAAPLSLLAALTLLMMTILPFATAAVLRAAGGQ